MNLALGILVLVNQRAESMSLWDNTGVGDGTNFPYGWQPESGVFNTQNPKKSTTNFIRITLTYKHGQSFIHNLTGNERTNYLIPAQGITLTPASFGMTELNFPDGIVDIEVRCSDAADIETLIPENWSANNAIKEAFLTFVRNSVRDWSVSIPTPVKNFDDIFDQTMANLVLDNIYYAVQFGQVDSAYESLTFLTELVNSGKSFTHYRTEHNI
jgi:hypothetical protein